MKGGPHRIRGSQCQKALLYTHKRHREVKKQIWDLKVEHLLQSEMRLSIVFLPGTLWHWQTLHWCNGNGLHYLNNSWPDLFHYTNPWRNERYCVDISLVWSLTACNRVGIYKCNLKSQKSYLYLNRVKLWYLLPSCGCKANCSFMAKKHVLWYVSL